MSAAGAPAIARALLVAGRALVVAAPCAAVVARLTRPRWVTAPLDDGGFPDHPILQGAMLLAIVFSLLFPLLVLPIGSVWLTTVRDGTLSVPTVLGRRRVDLGSSRLSVARVPGRGWSTGLFLFRDLAGRRVVVACSGARVLTPEQERVLVEPRAGVTTTSSDSARLALGGDHAIPWRRRLAVHARGWSLMLAWVLSTFTALTASAGAIGW